MGKIIYKNVGDNEKELDLFLEEISKNALLHNMQDTVIIKPNLCTFASVESGIISDIKFIKKLIWLIKSKNQNANIKIVETDSFDRKASDVYKELGYERLAEEEGVELLNLTEMDSFPVVVRGIPYEINVPAIFFDDIFFISVGNLKTHDYQKITCIFKNQFGCIPDALKEKYHPYLDEVLTFLDGIIKPDLSIIDGRIALEGNGPVDGEPVKCGIMIAGSDSLEVDTLCAKIAGFNPKKIPYLRYAYKKRNFNPDDVKLESNMKVINLRFIPKKLFKGIRLKIFITRTSNLITLFSKKLFFHLYYFGVVQTMRIIPKSLMKRLKRA
ncbi:MAG: DUF362 domain-containing protein [Candidatus Schekmanbacteria bacterium]|nr:MAG: DUF362 domain-containing protein [Candidatus Schekmanbacteria bacterium]